MEARKFSLMLITYENFKALPLNLSLNLSFQALPVGPEVDQALRRTGAATLMDAEVRKSHLLLHSIDSIIMGRLPETEAH